MRLTYFHPAHFSLWILSSPTSFVNNHISYQSYLYFLPFRAHLRGPGLFAYTRYFSPQETMKKSSLVLCSFFLLVVTRPADSNRAADVTWIYEEQKNGIMEEVFKSDALHVFVFIVVKKLYCFSRVSKHCHYMIKMDSLRWFPWFVA